MSDEANVDLRLIARQQKQLLDDMAQLRDDMRVMSAILMRLDGTVAGLVQEIRATRAQYDRLARRGGTLEGQP